MEMIHISKADFDRIDPDYKGIYMDYQGTHPQRKGRRVAFLPGYGTTLFVEGIHFVVDGDNSHLPTLCKANAEEGAAYQFGGGVLYVNRVYRISPEYARENQLLYLDRVDTTMGDFALPGSETCPDHQEEENKMKNTETEKFNALMLERLRDALEASSPVQDLPSELAACKPPVNKFGVKVGDLFSVSWGWEQTNVNFFQVVKLIGSTSVRVREVCPAIIEDIPVSGMAANRRYRVPEPGEILPPASRSSFVQDQEHGDLHRVQVSKYGGEPYIKVGRPGGYQDRATQYTGGVEYVSWYA